MWVSVCFMKGVPVCPHHQWPQFCPAQVVSCSPDPGLTFNSPPHPSPGICSLPPHLCSPGTCLSCCQKPSQLPICSARSDFPLAEAGLEQASPCVPLHKGLSVAAQQRPQEGGTGRERAQLLIEMVNGLFFYPFNNCLS